ncbi:MAG: hypothetical protein JRG93_12895 [Deltaproteobacteria bacterium]|nr:hypothetical protein [Deltaproteobacteria bacterium]
MRCLILGCACLVACAQPAPVQDPLDYLRLGVDPGAEADAVIEDLRKHGFEIGRRIDERDFVAFDAARGTESTVRVVTSRGPSLYFDRDGQHDVVVTIRERGRTCLAWAQVDAHGYASEVFRPRIEWGESPCVIEIDVSWPRLLLEVSVPNAPMLDARVRIPIKASARRWVLDPSPSATARWDQEVERRKQALEEAETRGDIPAARRLETELGWLDRLRKAEPPVLEPTGDGEKAR